MDQGTICPAQGGQTRRHRLMERNATSPVAKLLGFIPYRLQLSGGWIDQPFVSQHNPKPPGSMVVVQIQPDFRPMNRSGIAGGTRAIAMKIWKGRLPNRPQEELARQLYDVENKGKAEPINETAVDSRWAWFPGRAPFCRRAMPGPPRERGCRRAVVPLKYGRWPCRDRRRLHGLVLH